LSAASSFTAAGKETKLWGTWGWGMAYNTGLFASTFLIIVGLPLIMEIGREQQIVELERIQVAKYKADGYTDMQLQQMGFGDSLHNPPALVPKNGTS